ncbi:acyl carrier protein [Streptomyces sp. JJ38]|uniref:acyl carrier protein n=1 Tax=Streptomyces sp. JJ38 TaxID=2738128 RepID=UPI001C58B8D9|nr:acyl carrier protein [Streptomyces sp. JJ38]MBW1595853.1 acyl carrier protein [Streptomyces sp. JJ38]
MTEHRTADLDTPVAQVAELWRKLLKRDDVPHDVSFPELGGDSLLLIAMLTEIEGEFDVYLEAEDILDDLTVNGIARAVGQAQAAA